jgi:ABC-type amino acid transport substrate-binding protein
MSSVEKEERRISRRDFAKGAAVVGAGVLASCGPTPQVVKETVEVPVEVTKIVEKIVEVPAGEAAEAGPVTLELFDPTGAIEVTALHAPRLDTLDGKTICELTNTSWESPRTFPAIRELLQKQFPTVKIIPYTEFPQGTLPMATQEAVDAVKAAGCDAVITGNAG